MTDDKGLLAGLNGRLHDMSSDSRKKRSAESISPTGISFHEGYRKAVAEMQSYLYALSFPATKKEDRK